jgi:uncharacterized membrane protein
VFLHFHIYVWYLRLSCGRIFLKASVPLSLIKAFQRNLIMAGSISLDSTFNRTFPVIVHKTLTSTVIGSFSENRWWHYNYSILFKMFIVYTLYICTTEFIYWIAVTNKLSLLTYLFPFQYRPIRARIAQSGPGSPANERQAWRTYRSFEYLGGGGGGLSG